MGWMDDLRAQALAEDAAARCPVCGGYLGDLGECVTVGCGGAADDGRDNGGPVVDDRDSADREADAVCGDPGGIGVYCERPEGHDGPHGDRHSTWTVLPPRKTS